MATENAFMLYAGSAVGYIVLCFYKVLSVHYKFQSWSTVIHSQ